TARHPAATQLGLGPRTRDSAHTGNVGARGPEAVAAPQAAPVRSHIRHLHVHRLGEICHLCVSAACCPLPAARCPLTRRADSVLFLLSGLAFIAAILSLPHHVFTLAGRAWYYIKGEHIDVAASARDAVKEMSASVLNEALPTAVRVKEALGSVDKEL
ncbi:hypothetical protein RF55_26562, partial [Lasius niger]